MHRRCAQFLLLCLCAATILHPPLHAQADSLSPALAPHAGTVADQLQHSMRLLSLRNSAAIPPIGIPMPTAEIIADPHASFAWIPRRGSLPDRQFFSRAVEIAYVGDDAHDPGNRFYAIRYGNGSVELFVRDPLSAGGIVESWTQSMHSGTFTQMAAGDEHLALLRTDGTVECKAVPGFDNSTGALFESRASIEYTQIAAAALFTCGLRASDSHVECFGHTEAGGPVSLNSSMRSYSSIAAVTAGGFCGLALEDGNLYCWTAIFATEDLPTLFASDYPAPLAKPLWSGTTTEGCAMLTTGTIVCLSYNNYFIELATQTALDQATIQGGEFQGAARDDYRAIAYTVQGMQADGQYIFTPLRFIGVDAENGNDTICNCVRTIVPSELAAFVPCRTIAGAFARLSYPNTWIQLLPGTHFAAQHAVEYACVTFSSQPPTFSAAELDSVAGGLWVARMAATAGQAAVWNCTGSINCLTGQLHELTVSGLTFVGSVQHAISHASSAIVSFVSVSIIDCKFTRNGGMLMKSDGLVVIQRSEVFDPAPSLDVQGLLQMEDSALTMTDSWFHDILLPDAEYRMRSAVFVRTLNRATAITIRNCTWEDIEVGAMTDYEASFIGGIALQMITGATTLDMSQCTFRRLSTHCAYCNGGAIAIAIPPGASGDPETTATIAVTNSTFVGVQIPTPGYESSLVVSEGAGLWIGPLSSAGQGLDTVTVAITLTLADLLFQRIVTRGTGAAMFVGIMRALTMERVSVIDCVAEHGTALALAHAPGVGFRFAQLPFAIVDLSCTNTTANSWGGCVHVSNVPALVTFTRLRAVNCTGFLGGAVYSSLNGNLQTIDSEFRRCSAIEGGAIFAVDTSLFSVNECLFQNCTATQSGGAINAQFSSVQLRESVFEDCSLSWATAAADDVFSRAGGAVRLTGGSLFSTRSRFSRCSALPNDLQLSSCAPHFDSHTGLCTVGLGGALSTELSDVSIILTTVDSITSCSGALHFRGGSNAMFQSTASSLTAHSAAFLAADSVSQLKMGEITVTDSTAEVAGGSFLFFQCFTVAIEILAITRSVCLQGDGGAFWASSVRLNSIAIIGASFVNVSAPHGSGGVLFTLLNADTNTPVATSLLRLDAVNSQNTFNLSGSSSLYGHIQGSSIVSLQSSVSSLTVYPNQPLSDVTLPRVNVTALDAYSQAISMDRSLVVRVRAVGAENASDPTAAAAAALLVVFTGTTLQEVQADSGAAVFSDDLSIAAPPGVYTLLFSVVSHPSIKATMQLTVLDTCPPSLYYSIPIRSCIPCASRTLVYDVASNECVRCPAGWQRVEADDGSGPLGDGVSCAICPLGQVSTEGSVCAPCGPNTYQPTPSSVCVPCSSVSGLLCAGDGLAQVQEGYFALAAATAGGSIIETYQCPSSFCTSALVQQPSLNGSDASAVSSFGQCAFPRLASPRNLLCGECATGYRNWGSRCVKCNSANGGLVFVVFLLSLILIGWLLRSALGSTSAGHAVVVLYFVQTVMLELGTINRLLSWLNFTLFSPNTTSDCVAPLTPYQQVQAQILMPLFLECELLFVGLLHWIASLRWGAIAAAEATNPIVASAGSPLPVRLRRGVLRFISLFSINIYIAATISLLLFAYTQVCAACVSYLQCTDVGGVSVVFSQPAMYCDSSDYKTTHALVIAALVLYIAGLPVAIFLFLTARKKDVADAYLLMDSRATARARAIEEANLSGVPVAPSLHVSLVDSPTSRFVCRYAPLFAMYSSSAWFWQVFVVCRRVCFVALAVLLVRDPAQKFFAFSLAHMLSMLIQIVSSPFRLAVFNQAEFVSHVLLIVISVTLTAHPEPQHQSTAPEVFIFLLVVPPLILYALWAIRVQLASANQARASLWAKRMGEQMQAEEAIMRHNPAIELGARSSNSGARRVTSSSLGGHRVNLSPRLSAAPPRSTASPSARVLSPHEVNLDVPDMSLADPYVPVSDEHRAAL